MADKVRAPRPASDKQRELLASLVSGRQVRLDGKKIKGGRFIRKVSVVSLKGKVADVGPFPASLVDSCLKAGWLMVLGEEGSDGGFVSRFEITEEGKRARSVRAARAVKSKSAD